jgi:exonuclease SbcC
MRAAGWPGPTELSSVARRRRDEVAQLRAMGAAEAEADRLAAATDALQRRAVELDAQAQRVAARLDAAPARRAELEAARDRSQAAVAALPGAVAARDLAAGRSEAAARRDLLEAQRVALADVVRTRTDAAQTARQTWLDLRQARLEGMAAELAAVLADGVGCPVCGSTEHPLPAEAGPGSVGLDDETAAAEALAAAEDRRVAAADQLAVLDTRRAAARAAAGGDGTSAALRAAQDRAAAVAAALAEQAADAELDAAVLARFGEEVEGWVRERVSLDQNAATLKAQVLADRGRLRELRATLDDARGTDPTIAARVARLARLADGLDALVRQVETVDRLEEQVAAALERAERAAHDRGLDSLEAVLAAARDDEVLRELDEARRQHDADLASVTAQLAEPALSVLADAPAPDLHGLREQARDTQTARAAAVGALAAASARVEALLRLGAGLRDVLAERGPMAADHRIVDGLSRLAEGKSGDNRLRMSLSGYVLAGRLEQVAASASERLSRMSSGRYQLVHSADSGPGRARGGLHLRVLDAWTGVERDPASLSGGETFAASLSLALGLADVVTSEAGGTLLETLFVDEGFGSLDDDTLDEVMGVLDGLRDGGRTVGIVSHVADLQQRIPVQLRVEKGRAGSHVLQ